MLNLFENFLSNFCIFFIYALLFLVFFILLLHYIKIQETKSKFSMDNREKELIGMMTILKNEQDNFSIKYNLMIKTQKELNILCDDTDKYLTSFENNLIEEKNKNINEVLENYKIELKKKMEHIHINELIINGVTDVL